MDSAAVNGGITGTGRTGYFLHTSFPLPQWRNRMFKGGEPIRLWVAPPSPFPPVLLLQLCPLPSPLALVSDIDECQAYGPGLCGEKQCANTPGSYHCRASCQTGYQASASGDCVGEWRLGRDRLQPPPTQLCKGPCCASSTVVFKVGVKTLLGGCDVRSGGGHKRVGFVMLESGTGLSMFESRTGNKSH